MCIQPGRQEIGNQGYPGCSPLRLTGNANRNPTLESPGNVVETVNCTDSGTERSVNQCFFGPSVAEETHPVEQVSLHWHCRFHGQAEL